MKFFEKKYLKNLKVSVWKTEGNLKEIEKKND